VSVVARPTKVSVLVGRVSVPVLLIDAITGVVKVLLVSVWVSLMPTTALAGLPKPPAGKVTPAVPSIVIVIYFLLNYNPAATARNCYRDARVNGDWP